MTLPGLMEPFPVEWEAQILAQFDAVNAPRRLGPSRDE